MINRALSGVGAGLRGPHVPTILQQKPDIAWFELLTDNHLVAGGPLRFQAEAIAERYPVSLHCVNMNIAGFDPLDFEYINSVKDLATRLATTQISDHLAVTAVDQQRANDLLVFPRTEDSLKHIIHRVKQIQEQLNCQLIIENASAYIEFSESEISEAQFLNYLADETGCGILLDVNNVYVSAYNNKEDPLTFLNEIHWQHVREMHLAGHEVSDNILIDSHSDVVGQEVMQLLSICLEKIPSVPILFEWDKKLPNWNIVEKEVSRIKTFCLQKTSEALKTSA